MRGLVRRHAAQGRAVLVSSHLLAEVAQSVDDVVVISKGELKGSGTLERVLGGDDGPATEVRAQDLARLKTALEARGHGAEDQGDSLLVLGATPEQVGAVAAAEGIALLGLQPRARSLEAAFFALTGEPE
jgi:ABC-2 type transport system ATP-binding protein